MKVSFIIRINGIVQGVGMRPFIYRIARRHNLVGSVKNSTKGVEIVVTGFKRDILDFIEEIRLNAPPSSRISEMTYSETDAIHFDDFYILNSTDNEEIQTSISPDLAICRDCQKELINRKDRRYLYPFINCTNCGPRYSIIKKIPYDRPNTTMERFLMCEDCAEEYHNPADRRFHAQPNACPRCGPEVSLLDSEKREIARGYEAIRLTKGLIRDGRIVAIKGLGGFHIACDAHSYEAIDLLRKRKRRSMKPFAIMVPDIETAKRYALISQEEEKALTSVRSPIVLLKKSLTYDLPDILSFQNERIGIMLPYTPLHILLFYNPDTEGYDFDALVMTSGNISELPIEYTEQGAFEKLRDLVDAFLIHNREIYNRIDDSIVYLMGEEEIVIRRARGFVPDPVIIDKSIDESLLATGAELKGCFALNKGNNIILSQHLGDLKTEEGVQFFIHTYKLITDVLRINPSMAILDKHPDYLTREIVARLDIGQIYEVQHHYAHICSVLAECNYNKRVIGFAFDGTGYGDDGAIWGGEGFICDLKDYKRVFHLRYINMAGGDSASELCYIPAICYLFDSQIEFEHISPFKSIKEEEISLIRYSLTKGLNLHRSSSTGRLFDAVSFLLGLRTENSFEGEAAMTLEYIADKGIDESYDVTLKCNEEIELDTRGLIEQILLDIKRSVPKEVISARFHNYLCSAILKVSQILREREGIGTIVLSGGVFQNRFLLERCLKSLKENHFEVLINRRIPPNDGGISFGQISHYIYSRSS